MDLKWEYQKRADELAWECYNTEFCELQEGLKDLIYEVAIELVWDDLNSQADMRRKMENKM